MSSRQVAPRRVVQILPWVVVGVALILVLAAEAFLVLFSIAPLFGEYPTRSESRAVALAMASMVLVELVVAALAWWWGRRWLVLLFVLPAVAAVAQIGSLLSNTRADDESTRPPWSIVTLVAGFNLALGVATIILGVVLVVRRRRGAGRGSAA